MLNLMIGFYPLVCGQISKKFLATIECITIYNPVRKFKKTCKKFVSKSLAKLLGMGARTKKRLLLKALIVGTCDKLIIAGTGSQSKSLKPSKSWY